MISRLSPKKTSNTHASEQCNLISEEAINIATQSNVSLAESTSRNEKTPDVSSTAKGRNATYNVIRCATADADIANNHCNVDDTKLRTSGISKRVMKSDHKSIKVSNQVLKHQTGYLQEAGDVKQSTNTQISFVDASECKEASPVQLSSRTDSSIGGRSASSSCKSSKHMVHISKCKSPSMQKHVAKIMGCRASLTPRRKAFSTKIQACPQVNESCTQCHTRKFKETFMQTSDTSAVMSTTQTSPAMFVVDASTEFPDKVPLSLKNKESVQCNPSDCAVLNNYTHTMVSTYTPPLQGRRVNNSTATVNKSKISNNIHKTIGYGNQSASKKKQSVQKNSDIEKAKSHTNHKPDMKPHATHKLDFQTRATSKIGSLKNASHKPLGGDKKVYQTKLTFKETARSRIGSFDNIKHKPGGGGKKIEYQVVAKRSTPIVALSSLPDCNVLSSTKIRKSSQDRSASSEITTTRTTWSAMTQPVKHVTSNQCTNRTNQDSITRRSSCAL